MVKTYDEKLKEKKDKLRTFSDGTSLGDMQARLEAIELRLEEAGL